MKYKKEPVLSVFKKIYISFQSLMLLYMVKRRERYIKKYMSNSQQGSISHRLLCYILGYSSKKQFYNQLSDMFRRIKTASGGGFGRGMQDISKTKRPLYANMTVKDYERIKNIVKVPDIENREIPEPDEELQISSMEKYKVIKEFIKYSILEEVKQKQMEKESK